MYNRASLSTFQTAVITIADEISIYLIIILNMVLWANQTVLILTTLIIFPAYKVHERHNFLISLLGVTKPEEDVSYTNVTNLVISVTVCSILFSLGEVAMYFLYNHKVQLFDWQHWHSLMQGRKIYFLQPYGWSQVGIYWIWKPIFREIKSFYVF